MYLNVRGEVWLGQRFIYAFKIKIWILHYEKKKMQRKRERRIIALYCYKVFKWNLMAGHLILSAFLVEENVLKLQGRPGCCCCSFLHLFCANWDFNLFKVMCEDGKKLRCIEYVVGVSLSVPQTSWYHRRN
jgi:hypothetical protein